MKRFLLRFLVLFTFLIITYLPPLSAQNEEHINLAQAYYKEGEYEKAINYYQKLAKRNPTATYVYPNYLECLRRLERWKQAEKYLEKCIDARPTDPQINIDLGKLYLQHKDAKRAKLHFDKYINSIKSTPHLVRSAAYKFIRESFYQEAETLYLEAQKSSKKDFRMDLGILYASMGKPKKMLQEFLNLLEEKPQNAQYIQHLIQRRIKESEEWNKLEPLFFEAVQKHPQKEVFNQMLIWYFLQRQNFMQAFFQARALDKRKQLGGREIMEIGMLAFNNKEWKSAVKIFQYLNDKYTESSVYPQARHFLMTSKEQQIKNQFPVDRKQIESLVQDYKQSLVDLGWNASTAKSARNMALLQAFYLGEKDNAIQNLEKITQIRSVPHQLRNQSKLDMGDIYILKNEPWEASLLYSQAEKAEKGTPLAHQAKLKNAKLSYYSGEFKLAKAHLDILKEATSREIANDALDLSILIQENTGLDSTETAMKQYAAAELLVFQQQYDKALDAYDKMLSHFKGHSLTDEIYWQQASILEHLGRFEEAIKKLELVVNTDASDIYADNATFLLAKIYEEKLQKQQKAEQYYKKILVDYPSSIFVVEARKRIRKMRGDKVN